MRNLMTKRACELTFDDVGKKVWSPAVFFEPVQHKVRSLVSAEALRVHQAAARIGRTTENNWSTPVLGHAVCQSTQRADELTRASRTEHAINPTSSEPDGPVGGTVKRFADIVIAGTALVLLLPLMVIVALLIKITSPGPILFAHPRVGFRGKVFRCLKFRSMVVNGDAVLAHHLKSDPAAAQEWETSRKLARDPRVTWIGYLMRKSSIDELPQLFNVLLGDMSCIGPRPVVDAEIARYGTYATDYFKARPGVTGMWQVSGRSSTSYERRVRLDHYYIRRWSLWLDATILLKTVPCVLKFRDSA